MATGENWDHLNRELIRCTRCPRLVAWRQHISQQKRAAYRDWTYWGRPVPGFGDPHARLVVIGLAPGAHGSNRTGRMFTGDASGSFLYAALYRAGFASQPHSLHREDGLKLNDCFITAIVRCVPPKNRPTTEEIARCRPWLERELELLKNKRVLLTLGRMAHDGTLTALGLTRNRYPFDHGRVYNLDSGLFLVCSYHVSRQNTQTGRLTASMFQAILEQVRRLLKGPGAET